MGHHKEFLDNHYLKRMSASERQQWEEDRRHFQADIDSQGGKCAECGEPLDVDQQMMFTPPNMICDTCCYEMNDERNRGDRVL